MKKSVAILGTRGYPSYYGGFETAVRKLAPYLVEAGWDVTVYGRPGSVVDDDPTLDSRVRTVTTPGLQTRSLSSLTFGLTSMLSASVRKPDVALIMNVANGYWLPLMQLRDIPTVLNVDGMEWERDKWGPLAKAVFIGGAKATARWVDIAVFDSLAIESRWKADFGREGRFIPYGGDPAPPLPLEPGFSHRGYVLVVARFVPENSMEIFFDAVEDLAEKWPVVLVGSSGYGGPLEDRAADLAARFNGVTWLGHVRDDRRLLALWQHAGAYFHGHSVGGTNPALVQAMAVGAPTVARDTLYNREVLGTAGVFTAPSSAAIVSAISDLMSNPELQERLSHDVAARANDVYSWDSVCQSYELALEQAMTLRPQKVPA